MVVHSRLSLIKVLRGTKGSRPDGGEIAIRSLGIDLRKRRVCAVQESGARGFMIMV